MTTAELVEQMKTQVVGLANIDFGYPLGENLVRPACTPGGLPPDLSLIAGANWLAPLYAACDGVSLPDVHVGYFVKPLTHLGTFNRSSEPDTVVLDHEIGVLPFGSTGGGSLFVVQVERGAVMLLPPGHLSEGRYRGQSAKVKVVGNNVQEFLELLLADVAAFVRDDKHHKYLATL